MQHVNLTPAMRDALWQPLSAKSFLVLFLVLATCLAGLDVALYGPLTYSLAQKFVAKPAEREFGFHAEPREYHYADYSFWLQTIVDVTPGGAFDRAGIKPGFAFANRRSATGGPRFGGVYSVFAPGNATVRVRMHPNPIDRSNEQMYEIKR